MTTTKRRTPRYPLALVVRFTERTPTYDPTDRYARLEGDVAVLCPADEPGMRHSVLYPTVNEWRENYGPAGAYVECLVNPQYMSPDQLTGYGPSFYCRCGDYERADEMVVKARFLAKAQERYHKIVAEEGSPRTVGACFAVAARAWGAKHILFFQRLGGYEYLSLNAGAAKIDERARTYLRQQLGMPEPEEETIECK